MIEQPLPVIAEPECQDALVIFAKHFCDAIKNSPSSQTNGKFFRERNKAYALIDINDMAPLMQSWTAFHTMISVTLAEREVPGDNKLPFLSYAEQLYKNNTRMAIANAVLLLINLAIIVWRI